MKKINTLIIVVIILSSCQSQVNKRPILKDDHSKKSVESIKETPVVNKIKSEFIDTQFVYSRAEGGSIIIENSLPKGGLNYTKASGDNYIYAVFWTRISNNTPKALNVKIDLPQNPIQLSYTDNHFELFIPYHVMTDEKEALYNYGLTDFESIFENKIMKSASMYRKIHPNTSNAFYVIALFEKGVEGTIRSGFSLKDNNLTYRINDSAFQSGQIQFIESSE